MALPLIEAPAKTKRALLDVPSADLTAWLGERGEKTLRARQLRHWIVQRGVESFADMTDLPKSLREALEDEFTPLSGRVIRRLAADDGTHKLLIQLADRRLIECVLIQEDNRRTACISTQVGCGMGCVFCASGLNGVERNLTAGEILEQLLRLRARPERLAEARSAKSRPSAPSPNGQNSDNTFAGNPPRLTHIVVMGMGEPLANLDALLEALDVATAQDGLGIGARHITISTVGLPAKMRRLADLGKQYHLAVSLHAPNDALRSEIVPTNDKTGLQEILAAADYFFAKTGRQVTYEYVLLSGINDAPEHARELARLLQGRHAHVNLIPFNDVPGLPYRRPKPLELSAFVETLRAAGISVKVRKRKGAQIDAACGQLRRAEENR